MNRLGSHTIYSLVSSVAIPNECLVLSKVALHQIPRKWQAACRIISNGFPWCLKDVVFGCFSLRAVTEKVPNRGSQERQRRKRTLSCLCLFTLWPDGPLQNDTLLLFHRRKCFLHVFDCWEELNDTLRILSPECLTSVIVFCMTFWDPIGCLPLQEWGLSMWVLSKKWRKLRTGYPGSTSLRN